MSLSLVNLYSNAVDKSSNQNLVAAAIAIAAVAVLSEDPATVQHAARLSWAQKALLDPLSMSKKMIWGVLGDATIIAALPVVTDAQIQTSVNALVNNFLNA